MLDSVLLPRSWYTFTKVKNGRTYISEVKERVGDTIETIYRLAIVAAGYYGVDSVAIAIAGALHTDRQVDNPCTVIYNAVLGRYQVSNSRARLRDGLYIASEANL